MTAHARTQLAHAVAAVGAALGLGAAAFVYWWVQPVATMLVPAAVSALPLVGVAFGRFRTLTLTAAALMAVLAFLGGFSVGLLFVPAAVVFTVAASLSDRPNAPAH